MLICDLTAEERLKTGCSHAAVIDYTDINDVAALTKTLKLLPYISGDVVNQILMDLVTPFVGAALATLTLQVGWNGATIDSAPGLMAAKSILGTAAPVLSVGAPAGVLAAVEGGDIEAVFTSTAANLNVLTAGRLRLYYNKVSQTQLRNINGL
jgi:hypothetical protein